MGGMGLVWRYTIQIWGGSSLTIRVEVPKHDGFLTFCILVKPYKLSYRAVWALWRLSLMNSRRLRVSSALGRVLRRDIGASWLGGIGTLVTYLILIGISPRSNSSVDKASCRSG